MTYSFLDKARSQPDLADFCSYIEKPLKVLEEIKYRYSQLKEKEKFSPVNIEIQHKTENIINKHLPVMVENFCNFSFGYRNTEKIKVDLNTFLTPKELLLRDLSTIIEEIQLIEKEFNNNNSFVILAQTKHISKLGLQPALCLETGKVVKSITSLANKFDYNKFISENDFKNSNYSPSSESGNNLQQISNKKTSNSLSWMIDVFLIVGMLFLTMAALYIAIENGKERLEKQKITNDILAINSGVKALYVDNYSGLDKKNIVSEIISVDVNTPPSEINYVVIPESVNKENDSFSINLSLTEDSQKTVCEAISTTSSLFEVIKVGSTRIKSDALTPPATVLKNCLNKSKNPNATISLISVG